MAVTTVYLKGAIEPITLKEPMNATQLNMTAAARNNMLFFEGHDTDDHHVMIAIPMVLFLREEDEDLT